MEPAWDAPLEEIGKPWGVSGERVRQIEIRTKKYLSRHLAGTDVGADAA